MVIVFIALILYNICILPHHDKSTKTLLDRIYSPLPSTTVRALSFTNKLKCFIKKNYFGFYQFPKNNKGYCE